MSEQDPTGLTKLERLAVLLQDDGAEPETMNPQQLKAYLENARVDMKGPRKRLEMILKKVKAQQRLEQARQRRLRAVELAKNAVGSGAAAVGAIRNRVGGMIEKLSRRDRDQALVYAREFEKATPEDLATLEQDLALLEMESQEDETADPRDGS